MLSPLGFMSHIFINWRFVCYIQFVEVPYDCNFLSNVKLGSLVAVLGICSFSELHIILFPNIYIAVPIYQHTCYPLNYICSMKNCGSCSICSYRFNQLKVAVLGICFFSKCHMYIYSNIYISVPYIITYMLPLAYIYLHEKLW